MDKVEFIKDILRADPEITEEEIAIKYGDEINRMSGILLTLPGLIWTARKELYGS